MVLLLVDELGHFAEEAGQKDLVPDAPEAELITGTYEITGIAVLPLERTSELAQASFTSAGFAALAEPSEHEIKVAREWLPHDLPDEVRAEVDAFLANTDVEHRGAYLRVSHGDLQSIAQEMLEGFTVLAREIPHKGGRTFGYRISDGHSTLAYLSDHGPAGALGPGPDGFGPYHDAALELCRDVDVLIHDAQYTAAELPDRAHFGHSAVEYSVALARRSGAARVLLFHHDPDRTDTEIAAIERSQRHANLGENGVRVDAARQGDTICL